VQQTLALISLKIRVLHVQRRITPLSFELSKAATAVSGILRTPETLPPVRLAGLPSYVAYSSKVRRYASRDAAHIVCSREIASSAFAANNAHSASDIARFPRVRTDESSAAATLYALDKFAF
jgi:hypothetical protein